MSNKKRQDVQQNSDSDAEGALVPADGRTLTDMQAAFVKAYSDGPTAGNATRSGVVAGYSEKSAHVIGCQLLKLPHIVAAIDEAIRDAIGTRLTVKAVGVIERILDSDTASEKLKGEMAAKVVTFSGVIDRVAAEKAEKTGFGGKRMGELSRQELEALVTAGAAILKAPKGEIIDVVPGIVPGAAPADEEAA